MRGIFIETNVNVKQHYQNKKYIWFARTYFSAVINASHMIPMVNKTLQRHKTTIFVTTFQSKNRNDCSFKVNQSNCRTIRYFGIIYIPVVRFDFRYLHLTNFNWSISILCTFWLYLIMISGFLCHWGFYVIHFAFSNDIFPKLFHNSCCNEKRLPRSRYIYAFFV